MCFHSAAVIRGVGWGEISPLVTAHLVRPIILSRRMPFPVLSRRILRFGRSSIAATRHFHDVTERSLVCHRHIVEFDQGTTTHRRTRFPQSSPVRIIAKEGTMATVENMYVVHPDLVESPYHETVRRARSKVLDRAPGLSQSLSRKNLRHRLAA